MTAPHGRMRRARIIVLVLFAGVLLWVLAIVYQGWVIASVARSRITWARQLDTAGLRALQGPEFDSLRNDLATVELHLIQLRGLLRPVLYVLDHAGGLPTVGADLQAVPHLFDIGIEFAGAAGDGLPLARRLAVQTGSGSLLQAGLAALRDEGQVFDSLQEHVAASRAARAQIRGASFATPLGKVLQKLDQYLPLLDTAVAAAPMLPAVLGDDRPRSYLLLAQNSDELRATGGFISSVGVVTVTHGQVSGLTLRDSYLVDDITIPHPVPPEPMIRIMDIGVLLLRDVNWWPDFPTTAALAMQMWRQDQQQLLDGVIAVDIEGVRLLIEGVGPLVVEGEAQAVDGSNLVNLLRQRWGEMPTGTTEEIAKWWLGRKDFFAPLAKAAIARVQGGMGAQDALRLARALQTAIAGHHILVYSPDPSLRMVLADVGIDGAVLPAKGDYLMVVDTNMGYNKANAHIEQSVSYAVELSGGGPTQAHLAIRYFHKGTERLDACVYGSVYGRNYADLMERCYWDYVRVYAPLGALPVLKDATPPLDLGRDGDKETLATFFVVAPGEEHTVALDYALPSIVDVLPNGNRVYTLLVQKQAGAPSMPVRISVTLPSGARLHNAEPAALVAAGRVITFELMLDRDQEVRIEYGP